jgi:allophanate hydrolase
MLHVAVGKGTASNIKVWSSDSAAFGHIVAAISSPLSIGSVWRVYGRSVKGFLVEAENIQGAHDVSRFGAWRAAVKHLDATDTSHLGRRSIVTLGAKKVRSGKKNGGRCRKNRQERPRSA